MQQQRLCRFYRGLWVGFFFRALFTQYVWYKLKFSIYLKDFVQVKLFLTEQVIGTSLKIEDILIFRFYIVTAVYDINE